MKSLIYVLVIVILSLPAFSEDIWETYQLPQDPGINDKIVTNLVETPVGRIFMVSGCSFHQLYNNEWTNILKESQYYDGNHANIQSLTYDPNGIIWGASEMGFMKYTIATGVIEYLDKNTMVTGEEGTYGYLNGMVIDKNNNIWSVSRTPYLSKFDGEKFTEWDISYENKILALNFYSAKMITDNADNIWITGDDGVIKVATNSTVSSLNYVKYSLEDMKITEGNIIDIYFDSKDRIWASGLKGEISYFDGTTWIEVPIPEEMQGVKNEYGNFFINSILETKSGEMLFFWNCAGFYLSYGTDGILMKNMYPKDFFNDDLDLGLIFEAIVAHDGSILLGTYSNSLVKFSQSTSVNDESANTLIISPNPASDYITLNMEDLNPMLKHGVDENSNKIQIFNILGEMLITVQTGSYQSVKIDISDLPTGIYSIKSGFKVTKFIKK